MAKPMNMQQRKNILATSFRLFKVKGFNETTTREIAAECSVERGLLHYYYRQKQDILFSLYSDFLGYLFNYVREKLPEKDGITVTEVFNYFYYRVIFSDDDIVRIFAAILSNRNLTKLKIRNTYKAYADFLSSEEQRFSNDQLMISTTIAIGAEVELLLGMLDGSIPLTGADLATLIIRLEMSNLGFKDSEINDKLSEVVELVRELDVREFDVYMKEHCVWYN